MDQSANVTSIESLRDLRTAMVQFGGDAKEALVMLTLESRKAIHWLVQDRAQYWPDQLRKAQERVVHARNDLERCQLHYGSEEAPSCYDQKKALEKAKRRLKVCEEKVKAVRKWINVLREEMEEFEGELAKLTTWLEADLPRALALLERMSQSLDRYADYVDLSGMVDAKAVSSPGVEVHDEQPPEGG